MFGFVFYNHVICYATVNVNMNICPVRKRRLYYLLVKTFDDVFKYLAEKSYKLQSANVKQYLVFTVVLYHNIIRGLCR